MKKKDMDTQPLKILMLAPQPWFQPRGTPFSVLHRIKALTSLGHQVDLLTYHVGQNVPMENLNIIRSTRIPFIRKIKVGPSKTKLFLDVFMIYHTLRLMITRKYDLVHTHEEASFWGAWFARIFKLPHLYDMHSSLPQQLLNFKFTSFKPVLKIFDSLESYTIRNANSVITICPELQSYVEAHFPEKASLLIENVADNGIVFPPETHRMEQLREQYNLKDKRIVLYYGTFEPYQGLDMFIRAARYVLQKDGNRIAFVLVGGNEQQNRQYQDLVQKLDLSDHFVFTGFVQPQLVPAFVEMCDVLVSPRLKGNNSPLKIYSYLRSGKPIVATDHITHTQILDGSVAVLTAAEPEAFADGIIKALTDSTLVNDITRNAAKLAEEKYSYQDYLDKTRKIVELAMNGRSTTS